nr:ECF transporter S component [Heyndrickxia oleronia]
MTSKKIVWFALGFAFTVIGSLIKIPAIVGSVGLDAFPSLVIASLFSVGMGGIVAGVGHLLSALLTGFPLGPFHLLIAFEMTFCVFSSMDIYIKQERKSQLQLCFGLGMHSLVLFHLYFY